jgi:phosphate transport system substrate-binding protein
MFKQAPMRRQLALWTAIALVAGGVAFAKETSTQLDAYRPVAGVSGPIKSVGSDTMINLMTYMGEAFERVYPGTTMEVEGKGSASAPPALIAGTATIGPMSRRFKDDERDQFVAKYGYEPTGLRGGIDMLAVYVHKDNPIAKQGLTLQQVDAIFSKARKGGYERDITTWGDLGLTGTWKDRPITLYGRNSTSGTYGYFKKHALFKGDFKDTVKEQPGSAGVVGGVGRELGAIGYSGIGYKTADVAAVPLASEPGDFVPAEPENAYSGAYPLARFLWLYVNYRPNGTLDPLRAELVRFVFSREGQEQVSKSGNLPVGPKIADAELAKVGLQRKRTASIR